jgi:hypothetical protein
MSAAGPLTRRTFEAANKGGIVMSEFVYLYRSGEQEHRQSMGSPEQMQKTMQKWMAWMKELGDKGHLKDPGQPLERTGKVVKGKQKTVTDGPYAETKDIVGGYTLVEAKDLAQAVELSRRSAAHFENVGRYREGRDTTGDSERQDRRGPAGLP